MLTNGQKRALHVAAHQVGLPTAKGADGDYRLILRNVGGFYSAADRTASREGFIAVMAFFEQRGGGSLTGFTAGYWQAENAKANPHDALLHKIRNVARMIGWGDEQLDAWIRGPRMTNGQYAGLADLPSYWLRKVLEGLKAIARRAERMQQC